MDIPTQKISEAIVPGNKGYSNIYIVYEVCTYYSYYVCEFIYLTFLNMCDMIINNHLI